MVAALQALLLISLSFVEAARADHGIGVPINQYAPKSGDEAAIIKLIQTVAQGWERRDVDQIMSAYAPEAQQRAWNNPAVMVDYEGIKAEALGAFRDPKLGKVRFEDWIHRAYIVNSSAVVEINQRFHGWSRDHYYRDLWIFSRRGGQWRLIRYDYEPQPPFPDR